MAELKTKRTDDDVAAFIASIEDDTKRADSEQLVELLSTVTGEPAAMWGKSIVGFGSYHYVYESGREGDWFTIGFSPRKQSLTLYVMSGFADYGHLLERLGKHTTGKSCLYVKRLEDIDMDVLTELATKSVAYIEDTYP